MAKVKVAVLKTTPETVLKDHIRKFELADGTKSLKAGTPTILKDNISWHMKQVWGAVNLLKLKL